MNKIYKVIYSKVRNCYVVVSELAKNHSRGTQAEHTARKGSALTAALLLALSCVSVLGAPGAEAATKTKTDGSSFIGVERTDGTFEDSSYDNYNGGGAHGVDAITIGKSAVAGNATITIGDRNAAASIGSVYVGQGDTGNPKTDTGGWVTSVGFNSDATGYGSIAIGSNAKATNSNTNSGMKLQEADGTPVSHPAIQGASTALGYGASAADGALAMGSNASATNLATALGYGASAADGNIAIGANSVATAAASKTAALFTNAAAPTSYVSVGSSTLQRRLTNVADGADAHDAATIGQLSAVETEAEAKGSLKANVDASNIGIHFTGSDEAKTANAVAWATALGTGKVGSPNRKQEGYDQLVTGGTMWKELRQDLPTQNSIINMDFTTGTNLRNLDTLTVQLW